MMGAFFAATVVAWIGVTCDSAWLAIVGIVLLALWQRWSSARRSTVSIDRVAYRRLRNAPRLAPLIAAIGFSFILQNGDLLAWLESVPAAAVDSPEYRTLQHPDRVVRPGYQDPLRPLDLIVLRLDHPLLSG